MKGTSIFVMLFMALSAAWAQDPNADRKAAAEYRDRASMLEAKAARHEAEADRMTARRSSIPMFHKWPAMVQAPIDRERRLAMQARRAAAESLELAAKHEALAAGKKTDVE